MESAVEVCLGTEESEGRRVIRGGGGGGGGGSGRDAKIAEEEEKQERRKIHSLIMVRSDGGKS